MNTVLAGVLLQLSALALFVAMDTLLKLLTLSFAVPQLMWARFLFSFIAVTIAMRVMTGSLPWRSRAPALQTIRSLLLAACNFMFSSALVHIPLADATAVGFASPLFTLALAAVWLGERIGPWRWFGMALGFAGVVILLRPPFLFAGEPAHWAMILPLGAAALFAFYQILTRKLATLDDPRTTILHTSFAAMLVTSASMPLVWVWPSGLDWVALVLLGLLGGAAHGLLVLAFARAPASLLAPLSYTQMIWAVIAGLLVFGDAPDGVTLFGIGVIALSGVVVAFSGRPKKNS